MRQHEKSERQEARLETRREAEAHRVERTVQNGQLAAVNAPILADIAELKADLAREAELDREASWLAELEHEQELTQCSYDNYADPEWDEGRDEMDAIDLLYCTPLHLLRQDPPEEVQRQPSWLRLRLDDDPF